MKDLTVFLVLRHGQAFQRVAIPLKFSTWKAENDVLFLSSVHPLLSVAILAQDGGIGPRKYQDRFVLPPLDRADCSAETGPLKRGAEQVD